MPHVVRIYIKILIEIILKVNNNLLFLDIILLELITNISLINMINLLFIVWGESGFYVICTIRIIFKYNKYE